MDIAFQPFPRHGKAHGISAISVEMVYDGFTNRIKKASFLLACSSFFL
jgi:hypothetical protein